MRMLKEERTYIKDIKDEGKKETKRKTKERK